jgi:PEGA domain
VNRVRPVGRVLLGLLGLLFAACRGQDCLALPCALPVAIVITLTDAAGGPPPSGSTVHVSGALTGTFPCDGGTCIVAGTAGTYALDVAAPGFASAQRTVTVHGTTPECGCPTVDTERVSIVLPRSS